MRLPTTRFRRKADEAGAIMVEFAIGVIIMAVLISGMVQYGVTFGSTIDIASAARDAARAGSQTGTAAVTDEEIMAEILGRPNTPASRIEKVVIYRATTATEGPTDACKNNPTAPLADDCNIYLPADFANGASALIHRGGAYNYPPSDRALGTDFLGVWVKVKTDRLSRLVWSPDRFTDSFAMKIEAPGVGNNNVPTNTWSTGTFTHIPWTKDVVCAYNSKNCAPGGLPLPPPSTGNGNNA